MLNKLARLIEKHPWFVIGIIFMITIGLGLLTPFLEMGTSTEDFMPDDKIVRSSLRVAEYFGGTQKTIMIYVEKQQADSTVEPDALREEFFVVKNLEKNKEITGSICIANFVDIMCQIEFNKTLPECSNNEIETAFQDLMSEKEYNEIKMNNVDDKNEETDYNPHPRISKGKKIDSIDIKNYYIKENDDKICFSIEVYDLSYFENELTTPDSKMNVMEWYIDFKNLITPDEMLDINYKITAHIEPANEIWKIGNGTIENLRNIINNIKKRELFKSYKKEAYLWIQPPDQEISFPIKLETGNITFNIPDNRIEINVEKEELGKFGISPEMYGVGLPARIGKSQAGFRFYQIPRLKLPWFKVKFDISFIRNYFEKIQNRPVLNSISSNIISKFSNFSWEDFDELFDLMDDVDVSVETTSLKDMEKWWVITDKAPDDGFADNTFFIKPFFLDEIKKNSVTFLSDDDANNLHSKSTLILVFINETVGPMELGEVSKKIVEDIERLDSENKFVSMRATGEGVISYQIDEVTTEANIIILPAIFIAICIILLINFRKFSYIVLPLIGLSFSIIWLLGTMVILGLRFNTMHVAIVPLLMGLGVDYSVHIISGIYYYRKEGLGKRESIDSALHSVARPVMANALGLSVGLSVLFFSPLQVHIQAAAIMWVAMIVASLAALLLIPVFYAGRKEKQIPK